MAKLSSSRNRFTTHSLSESTPGTLRIAFYGDLAERVKGEAQTSHTTPHAWVRELVEDFIREHRSGKFTGDPSRHDDRAGSDFDEVE